MTEIALDTLGEYVAANTAAAKSPKYLCLFEAFSKGIRKGIFLPGAKVPSEMELSIFLQFSVGTVQRALAKLATNGLIIRKRKAGTFIADRKSLVDEVFAYRFQDPETGDVMLPFVRALAVKIDKTDGPWRRALGTKQCVRLDRLVWLDQDPPAYSSVFVSREHGEVFLDTPLEELHGSASHRILIKHFNLPTLRMEHQISCRALADDACKHLLLPFGTTGAVWDIRDYSFHDQPFLFQRYQLPPGHRPVELKENFAGVGSDKN